MPTLKELSSNIYDKIANKTLSPWCVLIDRKYDIEILIKHELEEWLFFDVWYTEDNSIGRASVDDIKKYKAIWHPIHIWVFIEYIYSTPVRTYEERELKVIELCDKRFEVGMDKSIPLDPSEEWRDLLEYLVTII